MKRILSLTLAALLVATMFAGCSNTPANYESAIKTAYKKNKNLTDFNVSTINEVFFDNGTGVYTNTTEKDYRVHALGDKDKFEMSEETTTSTAYNSTEYDLYYKNGKLYTNRYGGKFVTEIAADETEYLNYNPMLDLKYEDMKSLSKGTVSDSSNPENKDYTVLLFECKLGAMTEIAKQTLDDKYQDIKVVSSKGEYQINPEGYLTYQKLNISVTLTDDGKEVNASLLTSVKFENIGDEVNPYDPDEDTYFEIEDLNDAAKLYSAMTATLNSSELEIEYTGDGEIKQDDIDAGYKRTYKKIYSDKNEQLHQTTDTDYYENGKKTSNLFHGQYFKDGVYSNRNDSFQKTIYSKMSYSEFMANMFNGLQLSPAEYLAPGMMKNLSSKSNGEDSTVYSFELNTKSDEGVQFVGSLFGAFVNFGGDVTTAKVKVKSFSGKSYVDKDGYYVKSEVSCKLIVEFDEGKVEIASNQTINAKTSASVKGLDYPDTKGYDFYDKSELFGATK